MKVFIAMMSILIGADSMAAGLLAMSYKKADCELSVDGQPVKQHSQDLMSLMIEDRLGRFAQIQFGDDKSLIQYQLLIEDDLQMPKSKNVLVLQNLKVGELESSAEFSAKDVNWVRIGQGALSVTCNLK